MGGSFVQLLARELIEELADLGDRADDPSPLMRDIAAVMEESTAFNFEKEGHGLWPDLTEHTKARGRAGGKILQDSRLLAGSITSRYSKNEAIVGTNDIRAGTHQFGAEKGAYGETRHGVPIPFGDIPARPFLKLEDEDIEEMDELTANFFSL